MKRLFKFLIVLIIFLGVLFLIVRTPDTDRGEMHAKYGGELAHYTGSPRQLIDGELNVHYRDQGNPEGKPIIFIHGSNASLHTWEQIIANMGDDYRLISLDLPGHGLTGQHPDDDYGITGMFDGLQGVIDELNLGDEQLILVGNSMGGWVSWRYALENLQKIKALVLVDAGGAPTDDVAPLNLGFRLMLNPVTRPFTKHIMPRWIIKKSIEQTVAEPEKITDKTVDRYWELNRYPGNRHATTLRALLSPEELAYGTRLNEITTPTLILWGEKDSIIYVSSAHVFDAEIPDSQLIVYPEIGHIPMEENPAQVAADISAFIQEIKGE
jgi:pimeloyl-ACP methyl ester carboxylesterase